MATIHFMSIWWKISFKNLYSLLMFQMECVYLNWLCKYMKRSASLVFQRILVLTWVKHCFSLWVSLREFLFTRIPDLFITITLVLGSLKVISKRYQGDTTVRSSHKKCSVNKGVLKILQTSQQNNLLLLLLLSSSSSSSLLLSLYLKLTEL